MGKPQKYFGLLGDTTSSQKQPERFKTTEKIFFIYRKYEQIM